MAVSVLRERRFSGKHDELNKIKILFNLEEREIAVMPPSSDFGAFLPQLALPDDTAENAESIMLFCEIKHGI